MVSPIMVPAVIGVAIPVPMVIVPVSVVPATVNSNATGVAAPPPLPAISPDHLPAGFWANAKDDMTKTRVSTNKNFIFMLFLLLLFERRVGAQVDPNFRLDSEIFIMRNSLVFFHGPQDYRHNSKINSCSEFVGFSGVDPAADAAMKDPEHWAHPTVLWQDCRELP